MLEGERLFFIVSWCLHLDSYLLVNNISRHILILVVVEARVMVAFVTRVTVIVVAVVVAEVLVVLL